MFDFLGLYEHTIDDKGRFVVPSGFRDDLNEGLVITRGEQRYLNIFPLAKWNALIQNIQALPVYTQPRPANLRRLILAYAVKTTPDNHGRVRIPDHLREFAHINGEAVLAGVGDHIELWAPDLWQQKVTELETISIEDEEGDLLRI